MTSSSLGKRQASKQLEEVLSRETSTSSRSRRLGPKRTRQADWPSEWREQLALFRLLETNEARRVLYESWDYDLQRHVLFASSMPMRDVMKAWKTATDDATQSSMASQQPTQSQDMHSTPVATMEETSHKWTEGERIGEAKNPGPSPRQGKQKVRANKPPGTRAPGESCDHFPVQASQRGDWCAPTALAQELAKGNSPGLAPHSDHRGNRPGGSGLGENNSAAMRLNRSSRPGSAQGNKNQKQPREAAGSGSPGSPRGPPDQEERTTVQGRRLSALHRDFTELARTLHETAQNLQNNEQRSGAQWHPPPRWESYNPWSPLLPQWVAPTHQTSIGFAPPSHHSQPTTWERERESMFFPRCSRRRRS